MKVVDFNSVVDFLEGPGVRKWQFKTSGIKLINIRNIVDSKIDLTNTDKYLSIDEVEQKYKHFLLEDGDYIMASSGVTWGKIAEVKKEHLPLCLNTSIIKLKPFNRELHNRFLWHFIKSIEFTKQIDKLITGSAQPNFGPSHLNKIKIPLPPLKTQQHIAQILDDAAALRDKTKQLLAEYDLLAQAIFLEMFGEKDLFELDVLGNHILLLNSRRIPVKSADRAKANGKYPYYGASGIIDYVDDFLFDEETLLIGEDGANLISRSTRIAFRAHGKYWVNNHAHVISKNSGLNIIYLEYFINSINLEPYITGSAQPKLNSSNLKKIELPIPPIELQNQFADKIALIEQQKELAKQELQESEDLFNCLLQKAFKGELVFETA